VVDYKALPLSGAEEMWDDVAKASYSYDKAREVFNSYDNPRAVREKCEYVKRRGLGGVIIWESMFPRGESGNGRFWGRGVY
jgi:chitinase